MANLDLHRISIRIDFTKTHKNCLVAIQLLHLLEKLRIVYPGKRSN